MRKKFESFETKKRTMKKTLVLILLSLIVNTSLKAQCDSVFVSNVEIPQDESANIIVSIHNTSSTQYIYLNLILTDNLTGLVIAESLCGNLTLYPNQISVYEIDTAAVFCDWQLYYDIADIPVSSEISVSLDFFCNDIPWENTLLADEMLIDNSFILYPNPFNEKITLNFSNNNDIEYKLTLYNSQGDLVLQELTSTNKIEIDTPNLSLGMYLLKLSDSKGQFTTQKIIKH